MSTFLIRKAIRKAPGTVIHHIPEPCPIVEEGFQSRAHVGSICKSAGYDRVLLVADATIFSLGFHIPMVQSLEREGIQCTLFHDIDSEPTIAIVEAGRKAAVDADVQCIIALGGGSVLDASKMIAAGARLRRRGVKSLMLKFLYVPENTLPLITVPTTAGTGAEITVGAIIKNAKGAKCSTVIVGLDVKHVILDSELTLKAPRAVTAACGIDALSHGVEGCVADIETTPEDLQKSKECVRLVFQNLPVLLEHPDNVDARQAMCRAAHYGGNAINKQLAGYVHAFAHSIGAKYHIAHGNAIAMSMLPVLQYQKNNCLEKMADMAFYCQMADSTDSPTEAADKFLAAVAHLLDICEFSFPVNFIAHEDYKGLTRMIAMDSINYSAPITLDYKAIWAVLDKINFGQNKTFTPTV